MLETPDTPATQRHAVKDRRLRQVNLWATGLLLAVGCGYSAATAMTPAYPALGLHEQD